MCLKVVRAALRHSFASVWPMFPSPLCRLMWIYIASLIFCLLSVLIYPLLTSWFIVFAECFQTNSENWLEHLSEKAHVLKRSGFLFVKRFFPGENQVSVILNAAADPLNITPMHGLRTPCSKATGINLLLKQACSFPKDFVQRWYRGIRDGSQEVELFTVWRCALCGPVKCCVYMCSSRQIAHSVCPVRWFLKSPVTMKIVSSIETLKQLNEGIHHMFM